jgi:hypothetical protein
MRVASSTGAPINPDTDLMKEIKSALRDGQHEPTVVAAIESSNAKILEQLQALVRQGGGQAAGGPPSATLGRGGGGGGTDNSRIDKLEEMLSDSIRRLEKGVVGLEGDQGKQGYYGREVFISTLSEADRLFRKWNNELREGESKAGAVATFMKLLTGEEGQLQNTFKGLIASVLGAGLSVTNLGEQFSRLTHKVSETVGGYRTEVFGSNALGTGEYFLEFYNRVKGGFLTASDSFRTVLKTVGDSIEQNFQSPLSATGRDIVELSQDFVRARSDIKGRGTDLLARGTAGQTEKWMADMVDTLHNFGIKATMTSPITEAYTANMVNYLAKISANTGISVDKLEALVKKNAEEQNEMVGLNQLTAEEATNRSKSFAMIDALGSSGQAMTKLMNKVLSAGAPGSGAVGVMASDEHLKNIEVATPGIIEKLQEIDLATRQGASPEALRVLTNSMLGITSRYTQMDTTIRNLAYPGVQSDIAALNQVARRAGSMVPQSDAQKAREAEDPTAAKLNTVMTTLEEMITPAFRGIDAAILANIVALGANTAAIWANVAATIANMGGLTNTIKGLLGGAEGGIGATLLRGAGKIFRYGGMAAGIGGMAYEGVQDVQNIRQGNTGSGVGGLAGMAVGAGAGYAAGAALGTLTDWFTGPFGTIVGGAIGGSIGSWVGGMISPDKPMVGPASDATQTEQVINTQMASADIMSRIHENGEVANGWLSQIKGELTSQTRLLGTSPTPEGAPPVGQGLNVIGVAGKSAMRPDASYPASSG